MFPNMGAIRRPVPYEILGRIRRHFVGRVMTLAVATAFNAILSVALLPLATRHLGASDYGIYGGFFADPGKYEFYSCEQLLPQRTLYEKREQQLKLLMDKARQAMGGAAISVVAYQTEYAATEDELKVIDATARLKKCSTPANWASTSAIR